MKSYPMVAPRRFYHRGFTLLELLVVMVIIAILAALTLGAFRYAQESSARNRTVVSHGAIKASLEQYKEKFGEYPEPASPAEEDRFSGSTFRIGGAHMLYQAITGDGNSAILLAAAPAGGSQESDGQVGEEERDNVINFSSLPPSIVYPPKLPAGVMRPRVLVDGWNRPFQYSKASPDPNQNTSVNPTYDLWSFGSMSNGMSASETLESKRDQAGTAPWIKNW